MKSPLYGHYGGKSRIAAVVQPYVPDHSIYVEPFVGGAAFLYQKVPVAHEIIVDMDTDVINFWRIYQNQFHEFRRKVESVKPEIVSQLNTSVMVGLDRAVVYWSQQQITQASQYRAENKLLKKGYENIYKDSVQNLTDESHSRIKHVKIEHNNALRVLLENNSQDCFAFIDPPYIINGQFQTQRGYTAQMFNDLLYFLHEFFKGKFMLTCYQVAASRKILLDNKRWTSQRTNARFGSEVLISNIDLPNNLFYDKN